MMFFATALRAKNIKWKRKSVEFFPAKKNEIYVIPLLLQLL